MGAARGRDVPIHETVDGGAAAPRPAQTIPRSGARNGRTPAPGFFSRKLVLTFDRGLLVKVRPNPLAWIRQVYAEDLQG